MPRPWIGWRRKANILFLRIHSIKIRARVSWTACQAFCVPAKCDADAVKFSLSVLIPTWRRSHWLHIGTWLPYLSMLFFPYISGSFEIVMNFFTFVPMRKFYCATSARFVRSIPVRDVAIRSRHLGIVRALLEGKAHLTPDALHLTADHQSAEVHHSAMWRNGWEGHGRARSMVRSSKVKIVCNTFFRYELIPLCWTGVYVVKFWGLNITSINDLKSLYFLKCPVPLHGYPTSWPPWPRCSPWPLRSFGSWLLPEHRWIHWGRATHLSMAWLLCNRLAYTAPPRPWGAKFGIPKGFWWLLVLGYC